MVSKLTRSRGESSDRFLSLERDSTPNRPEGDGELEGISSRDKFRGTPCKVPSPLLSINYLPPRDTAESPVRARNLERLWVFSGGISSRFALSRELSTIMPSEKFSLTIYGEQDVLRNEKVSAPPRLPSKVSAIKLRDRCADRTTEILRGQIFVDTPGRALSPLTRPSHNLQGRRRIGL